MFRIVAFTFLVIVGLIVGCNGGASTPGKTSVLDIPALPSAAPEPSASPMLTTAADPTPASPGVGSASDPFDTGDTSAVTPTASVAPVALKSTAVAATGGRYMVRKGDTLFSIARTSYGSGSGWKKIAAANPGVDPARLLVGQSLLIPQ